MSVHQWVPTLLAEAHISPFEQGRLRTGMREKHHGHSSHTARKHVFHSGSLMKNR